MSFVFFKSLLLYALDFLQILTIQARASNTNLVNIIHTNIVLVKRAECLMTDTRVESAYFYPNNSQQRFNMLCRVKIYRHHYIHRCRYMSAVYCIVQASMQEVGKWAPLS